MFEAGEGEMTEAWRYVDRHPLAASLEATAPSPVLVDRLHRLEPVDCDDVALLEVVAGWQRVAAWAAARQARAVEELVRRAPGTQAEFVADDIATRLGLTRRLGQDAVTTALGLAAHPPVADALATGQIDARKAQVLLADTEHLPDHVADRVIGAVLGSASGRTAPQLRAALREAELALHPAAAAQRHEVARRDRCVRMVQAPDAMAWVHAFLPAADAVSVMTGLDALAATATVGDPRTADQRRADALTGALRRVLDGGVGPDGGPLPVRQHRRPHLHLTVSADAVRSGEPVGTGHLAGYGLVPLVAIGHLLADSEVHTVAVDPVTGERRGRCTPVRSAVRADESSGYRPSADLVRLVVDRDVTCRFPGCQVPSWRCDLDHVVPFDAERPAAGQTVAANLQALCRHHHRLKTLGRWSVSLDPTTGTTTWTSPSGRTYRRGPARTDPDRRVAQAPAAGAPPGE